MTAPMGFVEFEDEDDAVIPIERSHLVQRRCRCGGLALVATGYTGPARCGACRLAAVDVASVEEIIGGGGGPLAVLPPLGAGFPPHPPEAAPPYPAPEVDSRAPWDGSGTPGAVAKLAEKAVAASWEARVQRSRGSAPHAITGRPGAVKWWYALVLGNGEWSAYAVHDGAGWASVMLWGRTRSWFPHASVTDLAEYIDARGVKDDQWYDAIRERERVKIERARMRAACNRGVHTGEIAVDDFMRCPVCENTWKIGAPAWRTPGKGKEGMS